MTALRSSSRTGQPARASRPSGIGRVLRKSRSSSTRRPGGVALVDINNDGWLDIYLVNGSTRAALKGLEPAPRAALFRNDRNLKFTDVTDRAGVANERWGFGVAAGDIDNDGWTDLYVTNYGRTVSIATTATARSPTSPSAWASAPAAGRPARASATTTATAGSICSSRVTWTSIPNVRRRLATPCLYRGEPVMCGPRGLPGAPDRLFRNEGSRFVDVTARAGVRDAAGYYGFAATWVDVDDDADLDLLVVNDSTPNYLYRNTGKGTFEEVGFSSGFALNEEGREQAGMGLALGDYDNDGRVDTFITNFSDDSNTLRRNLGDGMFEDVTGRLRLRTPSLPFLGWGTGFLDYDNDGWLDLFVANGHVYPQVDRFDWGMTWAQRPLLFRNRERHAVRRGSGGDGKRSCGRAVGARRGVRRSRPRRPHRHRHQQSGPRPDAAQERGAAAGHWISVALAGDGRGPRDAIGAVVTLEAGARRWRRDVVSGDSYCSQSDFRAHFGLGETSRVDRIVVRWPDGTREAFTVPGVDRIVTLTKGRGSRASAGLEACIRQ